MDRMLDCSRVSLITDPKDKISLNVRKIFDNSDYEIKRVFYEQYQRLDMAEFVSLIQSSTHQTLGFLNLVDENIPNTLFLDLAVIKQFRNRQIGKKAIIELLEKYEISKYLIAETQINNNSANHMLEFFGDFVFQERDIRYYFIEGKRSYNEFLQDSAFEKLKQQAKVKSKSRFYER